MSNNGTCPIWGTPASFTHQREKNTVFTDVATSARAAGVYRVHQSAQDILEYESESTKARLTTWLIDQRQQGLAWPIITAEIIEHVRQRQPLPVHERANRLLRYLGDKTSIIGSPVEAKFTDQNDVVMEMKACSESLSVKELNYLGNYLAEQGWVDKFRNDRGDILTTITVAGYARIAELDAKNKDSSQSFVAMWFPDKKNKDYDLIQKAYDEGIDPGIRQAGYDPLKINDLPHNDQITDKIISEIRRSKFLVADFTHGDAGPRGGVYYEAGFARGYNIPVIYTCLKQRFSAERIHFDILQQNFILWTSPEDLHEKLKNRITGSEIGWGPNKPPAVE